MFCTQCGRAYGASDRFCGGCGTPRPSAPTALAGPLSPDVASIGAASFVPNVQNFDTAQGVAPNPQAGALPDWRTSRDARVILNHPDVRKLVEEAAKLNKSSMTAEDFFKVAEPFMKAAGADAVPLKLIADVAQSMYAKIGVKTEHQAQQGYASSFGRTLAAIACSLASRHQQLVAIAEGADGCGLQIDLPSTLTVMKAHMTLVLEERTEGTLVTGAVIIPGQASDWGHAKKTLADLHQDILNFRSLQS